MQETVTEMRIFAQPERLKQLRSVIYETAGKAGFPHREQDNIVLAVDEACSNIIRHAYHNAPDKEIRLTIFRTDRALIFQLQDDAPFADITKVSSRDPAEVRPGGLGLHFIRQIMDETVYLDNEESGNTLQMVKYFKS